MIEEIWQSVVKHRKDNGRNIALEVRMHPSVFHDCQACEYNEFITAFNASTNKPVDTMFGCPLAIDYDLNEGEWYVQSPRIK